MAFARARGRPEAEPELPAALTRLPSTSNPSPSRLGSHGSYHPFSSVRAVFLLLLLSLSPSENDNIDFRQPSERVSPSSCLVAHLLAARSPKATRTFKPQGGSSRRGWMGSRAVSGTGSRGVGREGRTGREERPKEGHQSDMLGPGSTPATPSPSPSQQPHPPSTGCSGVYREGTRLTL